LFIETVEKRADYHLPLPLGFFLLGFFLFSGVAIPVRRLLRFGKSGQQTLDNPGMRLRDFLAQRKQMIHCKSARAIEILRLCFTVVAHEMTQLRVLGQSRPRLQSSVDLPRFDQLDGMLPSVWLRNKRERRPEADEATLRRYRVRRPASEARAERPYTRSVESPSTTPPCWNCSDGRSLSCREVRKDARTKHPRGNTSSADESGATKTPEALSLEDAPICFISILDVYVQEGR